MNAQDKYSHHAITILFLALSLVLSISACQATTPSLTPGLTPEETTLEDTPTSEAETFLLVNTNSPPTPTPSPTPGLIPAEDTPDPGVVTLIPVDTQSPPTPSPTPGLVLEVHPLQEPPDLDNGTFLPVGSTQQKVLAVHQSERERTVYNQYYTAEGDYNPRTTSLGPGPEYTAVLEESETEPYRQSVTVLKGDEFIFSVDAGLPSPSLPLQGLWSSLDHWFLEVYFIDEYSEEGRLFRNGDFLNFTLDYQDAFGFQLLAGEPFYFFQRDGKLGYSYDGEEISLPYDEILHYQCCSAALLNPIPAENMVAFYALTGEQWYYVELGDFQGE